MTDLLLDQGVPLASLLPGSVMDALTAAATRVTYADEQIIHERDDEKPGLSIIQQGAVRFAKVSAGGKQLTNSILGPGDCFGEATLFAERDRAYDAYGVGATVIDQIPKTRFDRIFDREPLLARALLIVTTRRLYGVLDFLDDLRSLPLTVRTAKLLATMSVSAKDPARIECKQHDLAFTLGVSRVSVGKALSALHKANLIDPGYGAIRIHDRERLDAWIAARNV